jgi:hypothetical protein
MLLGRRVIVLDRGGPPHARRRPASWRTGSGPYQHVGTPPPEAELPDPTIEDASHAHRHRRAGGDLGGRGGGMTGQGPATVALARFATLGLLRHAVTIVVTVPFLTQWLYRQDGQLSQLTPSQGEDQPHYRRRGQTTHQPAST